MKKIINDPEQFVEETIDGILAAWPGYLRRGEESERGVGGWHNLLRGRPHHFVWPISMTT